MLPIALYNIVTYFHLYHKHYPKEKALDWSDGHKSMVQYVGSVKDNYDSIAITKWYGHPYVYLLFYLQYDPAKYQPYSENKDSFDKFVFFEGFPKEIRGKTLVINAPEKNFIKEIKMNNGDTVFVANEIK